MDGCKNCANIDNEYCFACDNGNQFKPMTNADRIRAMSDEELAKWLVRVAGCRDGMTRENAIKFCTKIIHCDKCWLDLLRQEAKE